MSPPRSPARLTIRSRRRERRIAFRESPIDSATRRELAVTERERAVLAREQAARLREEAACHREEAAGLREDTARVREETDRAEATSVKVEADQIVLQLREANQQLVIASLREQTLTEEARQANRVKDLFLATVSHELRTPLTAVIGWTHLLRINQLKPERVGHAIATIERNAAALAQLIEDLLDVSRITTGTLRVESQPVSLIAVTVAAIETARPAAAAKGVHLHISESSSAEPIMGDARRLLQVVGNLLSNAIKFTDRDGRVDIDVRRVNASLELRISDTGRGVSAEFLPFMFERFRMADVASTRREGGLGLGLAIVRQIVDLHGGHVRVESPGADQGTTVTVTLPIAPQIAGHRPTVVDEHRNDDASADPGRLADVTVLLVEDHEDERELITLVLEAEGATVTGVASAREALTALEVVQPDVLVSDIALPNEDGHTLIRQIRSHEAEHGGFLAGIAMTGDPRVEDRAAAVAAGFQGALAKLAASRELTKVIAAVVPAARQRT